MKIRSEFVSNSSSCSFYISESDVSVAQYKKIIDHINVYNEWLKNLKEEKYEYDHLDQASKGDAWSVRQGDHCLEFYTSMDNFDMHFFLTEIVGIDESKIRMYNHG